MQHVIRKYLYSIYKVWILEKAISKDKVFIYYEARFGTCFLINNKAYTCFYIELMIYHNWKTVNKNVAR